MTKKLLMTPVAVGALAVALASCGGSSQPSNARALLDTGGRALYAPDGETASSVHCVGACTRIWMPVRPGAVAAGAAKLGVITRPDGSRQVTAGGRPLYTFAKDVPGSVNGDGASDAFGGTRFTWHVVSAAGAPARPAGSGGGGGYGSSGAY
jgi:predicted lipoprotein with Yx(FWY)xxD motif